MKYEVLDYGPYFQEGFSFSLSIFRLWFTQIMLIKGREYREEILNGAPTFKILFKNNYRCLPFTFGVFRIKYSVIQKQHLKILLEYPLAVTLRVFYIEYNFIYICVVNFNKTTKQTHWKVFLYESYHCTARPLVGLQVVCG